MEHYLPTLKTRFEKERWTYTKPKQFGHCETAAETVTELAHSATQNMFELAKNTLHHGQFSRTFTGTENIMVEQISGDGALFDTQNFEVEAGAHMLHLRLHTGGTLKRDVTVNLGEKSTYSQITLTLNSPLSRCQTDVHLNGEQAHVNAIALCLLSGKQHVDTNIHSHFHAENCTANIQNKNLITGAAHAVFQGKFHVDQAAQLTDAYMLTENTLLPNADGVFNGRASHKPELEIYADDVKCSHGAATGTLNADHLFYLQARGIPLVEAKFMLLQAQIQTLLNDVPEHYQPQISALTNDWLNQL